MEQSGLARWAHNPKVKGSNPFIVNFFLNKDYDFFFFRL